MNELERIREDFASQPCNEMHSKYYKEGFNDAIELNLPVLFARWLHNYFEGMGNFYRPFKNRFIIFDRSEVYTPEELYTFWINNIYGK